MRLGLTVVAAAMSAVGTRPVLADEGELQLAVQPTMVFLSRHDRVNRGVGASLSAGYGVRDWLAASLAIQCERLNDLRDPSFSDGDRAGKLFYDATRCSVVPSAVLRLGAQWVLSAGAGLGYRFETQSSRDLVSAADILLDGLDSETRHELVVVPEVGLEYRFRERFSAGVRVIDVVPLGNRTPHLDLSVGVVVSMYLYP